MNRSPQDVHLRTGCAPWVRPPWASGQATGQDAWTEKAPMPKRGAGAPERPTKAHFHPPSRGGALDGARWRCARPRSSEEQPMAGDERRDEPENGWREMRMRGSLNLENDGSSSVRRCWDLAGRSKLAAVPWRNQTLSCDAMAGCAPMPLSGLTAERRGGTRTTVDSPDLVATVEKRSVRATTAAQGSA